MSNETECVALLEDRDLSLYTSKFVGRCVSPCLWLGLCFLLVSRSRLLISIICVRAVNKIFGPTFSSVEGAILSELIPLLGDRWKFIQSRQAWLQNGCPLPGSANLLSESPPVILVTQLLRRSSF